MRRTGNGYTTKLLDPALRRQFKPKHKRRTFTIFEIIFLHTHGILRFFYQQLQIFVTSHFQTPVHNLKLPAIPTKTMIHQFAQFTVKKGNLEEAIKAIQTFTLR
ncbi:MAG: hypothetical protein D6732_11175 [Methanobacteriota archaeon]|nr:MAG: hypothetical protein D6732_11175 [Euryarchaeota archaeon]